MNNCTQLSCNTGLLTIASRVFPQCLVMVVVFNYRCGTVPDFHRVPSFVPVHKWLFWTDTLLTLDIRCTETCFVNI